mgnify:CR=1 FL=1
MINELIVVDCEVGLCLQLAVKFMLINEEESVLCLALVVHPVSITIYGIGLLALRAQKAVNLSVGLLVWVLHSEERRLHVADVSDYHANAQAVAACFAKQSLKVRLEPAHLLVLEDSAAGARLQLLEEIVALVVYEDECREVLNINLPDGLHAKFWVLNTLNALDAAL